MLEYVNGYAMPAPKGTCCCGCGEAIRQGDGWTYKEWSATGYVYQLKLGEHVGRWLKNRVKDGVP